MGQNECRVLRRVTLWRVGASTAAINGRLLPFLRLGIPTFAGSYIALPCSPSQLAVCPIPCDGRWAPSFLPPKALHGLMSNSSEKYFCFCFCRRLWSKCQRRRDLIAARCEMSARDWRSKRSRQASVASSVRAVVPSANCPLPPSIFYVLSVSRVVRPSSLSGRSPPSLPASPNSASSQRRSLPARRVGPIYGNLVEGAAAASGPFLEVVVGKQETAVDAVGRLVNAGK